MKIKYAFIALILLFISTQSQAQYYFYDGTYYENDLLIETGITAGGMNALTDIGGRKGLGKRGMKDFNLKTTDFTGGLFVGLMYKNSIGLRLEANFGNVHSYDSILVKVAPTTNERYERNLSFRTPITEVLLLGEFHPFEMFGNYNQDKFPPVVSPYFIAGIGYYHFNPKGKLNGRWIDLKPLHTEGQGFSEYPHRREYSLHQINVPLGFGARYDISPHVNLRAELIHRILFTDYIDDVSVRYIDPALFSKYLSGTDLSNAIQLHDRSKPGAQTAHPDGIRGDPKHNDAYLSFTIKLGFTIGRDKRD